MAIAPRWPYCPPPLLRTYIDPRVLSQIVSDTDTDVPVGNLDDPLQTAYQLANENLKVAAALIDSAVTEAGKYDVADLVWLASDAPSPGVGEMPVVDHGAYLRRLNAALWVGIMQDRRVRPDPEASTVRRLAEWGLKQLDLVREGKGLVPARGSLGLLPADYVAARAAALSNIQANVQGGLPGTERTAVGVTANQYPPRLFGTTDDYPPTGDRLSTGLNDGGLGGA